MDSGPIHSEPEQTVTYMLKTEKTKFYRHKEEFKRAQKYFVTYMNEATYWQKMENWIHVEFSDHHVCDNLVFFHMKIIHASLMVLDEIPQVYKTDTFHICTTSEEHMFTLPPLLPDSEEGSAKAVMTLYKKKIILQSS